MMSPLRSESTFYLSIYFLSNKKLRFRKRFGARGKKNVSVHYQPSRNYNYMCKNDYTHTVTLYITSVNLIAFAIECWKCDGG